MKAREPDETGFIERDGVRVAWQVYGELHRPADPAVLLLPTWCIVPAEIWKLQVAFLSRRTRVITFDPRGNGASDRPEASIGVHARRSRRKTPSTCWTRPGPTAPSWSRSRWATCTRWTSRRTTRTAWPPGSRSRRRSGTSRRSPRTRQASFDRWAEDTGDDEGWGRYNRYSWLRDYPGFLDFFFDQLVPEEHSTKLIEDLVEWGRGTTGETLVRAEVGRVVGERRSRTSALEVRCPVVVVHGTDDRVIPYEAGARLAELTGGTLVTFEGSGHAPQGRDPVAVNRLVDRVLSASSGTRTFRRSRG